MQREQLAYVSVLKSRALLAVVLVVFAAVLAAATVMNVVGPGDTGGGLFGDMPVEEIMSGPAALAAVAGLAAVALLDMGVTAEGSTSIIGNANTLAVLGLLALLAFWAAAAAPSTGSGDSFAAPTLATAIVAGMVVAAAAVALEQAPMDGSFLYGTAVFAAATVVLSYGLGFYFELVFSAIEEEGGARPIFFALSCAAVIAVLWGLGGAVTRLHLFARGPNAQALSPDIRDTLATTVSAVVVTTAAVMWRFHRPGATKDGQGWLVIGGALLAAPLIALAANRMSSYWGPGAEVVKFVAILAATAYVGLGFVPWSIALFGLLSAGVIASYAMGLGSLYARVAFFAMLAAYGVGILRNTEGGLFIAPALIATALLVAMLGDSATADTFAGFAVFYTLLILLGFDDNAALADSTASTAVDFLLLFVAIGAVSAMWQALDFRQALHAADLETPPVVRAMTLLGTGATAALLYVNLRTDQAIRDFVAEASKKAPGQIKPTA